MSLHECTTWCRTPCPAEMPAWSVLANPLGGTSNTTPFWRGVMGNSWTAAADVRGRGDSDPHFPKPEHSSPLPVRCASDTFQSSLKDPDSLTFPGRYIPGTGRAALALAQRLDQIQLLSSRCDKHNSTSTSALLGEGSTFAFSGTRLFLHHPARDL